jgi:hypothetical protein
VTTPPATVQVVASFVVVPGKLADVEAVRQQLLAQTPTGIPAFSLVVSADQQRMELQATAETYDAFQGAVVALGPLFAQLDGVAQLASLTVTGDVPNEMREALGEFNPTFA